MQEFPKEIKSWAEAISYILASITFIVGLIVSFYKFHVFIKTKTKQVESNIKESEKKTEEITKRISFIENLELLYVSQLNDINRSIAEIDEEFRDPWKATQKKQALEEVRALKVKEREILVHTVGKQIFELKTMASKDEA